MAYFAKAKKQAVPNRAQHLRGMLEAAKKDGPEAIQFLKMIFPDPMEWPIEVETPGLKPAE